MPVHSSLNRVIANEIIQKAISIRVKHGFLPIAVAVLDAGGHLIAYQQEDGSSHFRFALATGKATAALGLGMSSRLINQKLAPRPVFQTALAVATDGKFIPVPGGILLLDPNRVVIGAIGISGDTSDVDEYCAITAARQLGIATEPSDPDPSVIQAKL